LSDSGSPAGWYPDPGGGGQRYYDGNVWTSHTAPWPAPVGAYASAGVTSFAVPTWKGQRYGRPHSGPGALADPGRRLGARLLDGVVLLPVVIVFVGIAIALVAPHAGPIFPTENAEPGATNPTPGFIWIYLAVIAASFFCIAAFVVYEAVMTKRYGRTLGKKWLGIRPITTDGAALGWGASIGRAAAYGLASCLSWIGFLDYAWCLWDADGQCVHDKVVGTLVIRD
jgi:uncharacterized RDD family membrane protein YckC